MSRATFKLTVVTPMETFEREACYIRMKDSSGFFGIMKGHQDFLTTLLPSLGYYRDKNEEEHFLAINGGVLQMRQKNLILTSREVFENDDPEELAKIIDGTMLRQSESETAFQNLLEGIENAFLQKSIAREREKY